MSLIPTSLADLAPAGLRWALSLHGPSDELKQRAPDMIDALVDNSARAVGNAYASMGLSMRERQCKTSLMPLLEAAHRAPTRRQRAVARACGAPALDRTHDRSAARSTAPIPHSHWARQPAPMALPEPRHCAMRKQASAVAA